MKPHYLSALATLCSIASALSPDQWRQQSIYQVITDRFARTDGSNKTCDDLSRYCGGTYQGIVNELDYIQGMGFTAIWISPVIKNIQGSTPYGEPYHGYWGIDPNSFDTPYGSADDLKHLSTQLHAKGMYLMVDVVTNHLAQAADPNHVDFSKFAPPFNRADLFHPYCPVDYNNMANKTQLEECWCGDNKVPLVDLKTEDASVRGYWNTAMSNLLAAADVDGLRIDSATHVDPESLKILQDGVGGMHVLAEALDGNADHIAELQNYVTGAMNYPTYFRIKDAFASTTGDMGSLYDGIESMKHVVKDTTLLGAFLENHDLPRFPSMTQDRSLTKNAVACAFLQDGIPIIYQGQEQSFSGAKDPYNREALWPSGHSTDSPMYNYIKTLNKIRTLAITQSAEFLSYKAWAILHDSRSIVIRRGFDGAQVLSVFSNYGEQGGASLTIPKANSGVTSGQEFTNALDCQQKFTADGDGNLDVTITSGLPLVLLPSVNLAKSDICAAKGAY